MEKFNSMKIPELEVKQTYEDAVVLIVQTAIEKSNSEVMSLIIGEDIDLLIILSQLSSNKKHNVYQLKYNQAANKYVYYSPDRANYPSLNSVVAFLHAFSGCDTTSSFFKVGKTKIFELYSLKILLSSNR